MVSSIQLFSAATSSTQAPAADLAGPGTMKGIVDQNAQAKALMKHSRGKSTRAMRATTELAIKDAFASLQKHFPEIDAVPPRSGITGNAERRSAVNRGIPALPAEMWTEIIRHLKETEPAATKTLRLVNKQLKEIAERDVKTVVIKNNEGLQSLKQTGSYREATKLLLLGNEGAFRNIPTSMKGKIHYLGRKRGDLAWNYFNKVKKATEGTTFSLLDVAKTAGIKVSDPPERNTLSALFRSLFGNPAKEVMEHYLKQGFTAEEAAEITNVDDEKTIAELGGRGLSRYPAQLNRHRDRELLGLKNVVEQFYVSQAMEWLKEQERAVEQRA